MLSQKEGDNERPTENGRIIISGVLAAFALFSKQSGIVLPAILAGWMLWEKKYRQLFLFVCYYAVTACLFIACIWLVNGLDMFYKNVVQGVDNGISPGWFRAVILPDFYLRYGLILVPVFVVLLLLLKRETKTVLRFSLFATILLFVLANGLAIKNGSNPGYFTEWWTMVFILIVYYWERHPSPAVMWMYTSIICLVLVLKGIEIVKPLEEKLNALGDKDLYTVYVRDRPIADKILNNLGRESKYIVFLNFNTAESYLSNMLFRHAVMPQMDIVALAAYPRKKYD